MTGAIEGDRGSSAPAVENAAKAESFRLHDHLNGPASAGGPSGRLQDGTLAPILGRFVAPALRDGKKLPPNKTVEHQLDSLLAGSFS
jgi:hypothetical protein